jgi:hypothetical protein
MPSLSASFHIIVTSIRGRIIMETLVHYGVVPLLIHTIICKRPCLLAFVTHLPLKNHVILKALCYSQTVLVNSSKDKKGSKVMSLRESKNVEQGS